jgi:hypothetical protein
MEYQPNAEMTLIYEFQRADLATGDLRSGDSQRSAVVFVVPKHAFDQDTWLISLKDTDQTIAFGLPSKTLPKWTRPRLVASPVNASDSSGQANTSVDSSSQEGLW